MFRHFLVGRVIDAYLLAVQLHDDRLSCEVVGYRVMASLDRYGGLLVRCALKQVEAPKVTGEVQHTLHVPAQGLLLITRSDAAALFINIVAYAAQPQLCTLDGVKVHTGSKGTSPDVVHTTLHMSLLPSCTGISKTVSETIESTHTQPCLGRFLSVRLEDDGHLHVIVYHRARNPMHVMEEITV